MARKSVLAAVGYFLGFFVKLWGFCDVFLYDTVVKGWSLSSDSRSSGEKLFSSVR